MGVADKEVRATDLFPELSDEIDRRIMHSEQRIKYWVMGGIVANLLTLLVATIPMVFYLGQISRDVQTTVTTAGSSVVELKVRESWMRDRIIWEAAAEQWMESQGFKAPPAIRGRR